MMRRPAPDLKSLAWMKPHQKRAAERCQERLAGRLGSLVLCGVGAVLVRAGRSSEAEKLGCHGLEEGLVRRDRGWLGGPVMVAGAARAQSRTGRLLRMRGWTRPADRAPCERMRCRTWLQHLAACLLQWRLGAMLMKGHAGGKRPHSIGDPDSGPVSQPGWHS